MINQTIKYKISVQATIEDQDVDQNMLDKGEIQNINHQQEYEKEKTTRKLPHGNCHMFRKKKIFKNIYHC